MGRKVQKVMFPAAAHGLPIRQDRPHYYQVYFPPGPEYGHLAGNSPGTEVSGYQPVL